MKEFSGIVNIYRALAQWNYGLFALGNQASLIGRWVQRVAIGWYTWELTGSSAWLGAMAFADMFPTIVCAPIAGVIADRWDKIKLIKLVQLFSCFQALALFALMVTGHLTVEILFLLALLLGVFTGLGQPVRVAVIPDLVKEGSLAAAISINALAFHVGRFAGPAIAGLIIKTGGIAYAFAINAGCFLLFLAALMMIRPHAASGMDTRKDHNFLGKMADGFRYVRGHAGIRPLFILIIALAIGARPFVDLFPAFADVVFKSGVEGLAILMSSVGIGAVLGGFYIAGRSEITGLVRLILIAVSISAVSLLTFASVDQIWIAAVIVAVFGMSETMIGVSTQTLILSTISPDMRGRVISIYVVVFRALPAFGALVMGAAAEFVGLRWPVLAGGIIVIVMLSWALTRYNSIRTALESTTPGVPAKNG
ncbi:MAG: MFS transporter [Rhodospirillales bacterium]